VIAFVLMGGRGTRHPRSDGFRLVVVVMRPEFVGDGCGDRMKRRRVALSIAGHRFDDGRGARFHAEPRAVIELFNQPGLLVMSAGRQAPANSAARSSLV